MAHWKTWLLPVLLAAAQFAFWPGLPLVRGDTVAPLRLAAVAAITAVIAVALGLRRRAPVAVTAVTTAALSLGLWVMPGQEVITPGDAMLVISVADLVALYGVAVLCSRRTTALVLAAVLVWQVVVSAAVGGVGGDYLFDQVASVACYVLVTAFGRIRRRSVADRAATARRVAEAEETRREATAAERRRLARELHDVTAHHLTSIVVNASAAQFLGDQRPELRAEALDFAARTGRQTLEALRRLVAILPSGADLPAPAAPSVADLADDFRQLGQVVEAEIAGEPPSEVAEAMHGIAREALTNTLRYAPGGTVRLRVSYGPDGADLVVEDDGAGSGPASATGLGGGRGLTGMHERAAALGGTLEAGPHDGGMPGWRVHAVLPAAARARRVPSPHSLRVLDACLVLLTLSMPLTGFAVMLEDADPPPAAATLILLALIVHSAPLLWRRQHPWWVLTTVGLTTWLGPLLMMTGVVPAGQGSLFLFSVCADLVAVHAVASRGARPRLTWLAPAASLAGTAFALAALVALDPPVDEEPLPDVPLPGGPLMTVFMILFVAVAAGFVLALPLAGSWLVGDGARRRRQRRHDRERSAVAVAMAHAEWRAWDERARVAAGLREAVLEHAARVPRAAEAADLTAVLDSAREALAAMRGLLDGLGGRPLTTPPAGLNETEVASSPSV